ncbi:MAG: hypothetical protein ABI672_12120 [Vicinamibacteria bacterium]
MADPIFLKKRLAAFSVASMLLGLGAVDASAQTSDNLARVNQDELASFYGRMNVVVGSGARAFGMGGAFLARADDATAASWNPAGLSYLRRTEFSLVGVHNDFVQKVPKFGEGHVIYTKDQLRASIADFAGVAYPLRLWGRSGAIQASYQRAFSFSGSRRSEDSAGLNGFATLNPLHPQASRVNPTEFTVEGAGGFDTVSLSSGFEVSTQLRVGLSLNRWVNGFSQTVNRPDVKSVAFREISSDWDLSGKNVNLGVIFTPIPDLNFGAVLKTPFEANVRLRKSRIDFDAKTVDVNGVLVPVTNQKTADVKIKFPRVYGFGTSYRIRNTITLSADFTRTDWSKATISDFFSLGRLKTEDDTSSRTEFDIYPSLPFPALEESARGQVDTNQFRFGAEWVLRLGASGNKLLPLRAGFFRDGQPFTVQLKRPQPFDPAIIGPNDPQPPIIHQTFSGVTAGVGITVGGVLLDLAYVRESGSVRAASFTPDTTAPDPLFPDDPTKTIVVSDGIGVWDSFRTIKYNRFFASVMIRFGPRR